MESIKKSKKKLTKVQKELTKTCNEMLQHTLQFGALLQHIEGSYSNLLNHDNIKGNEEIVKEITEKLEFVKTNIEELEGIYNIIKETFDFIPTKKKDTKLYKKLNQTITDPRVINLNEGKVKDNILNMLKNLEEVKSKHIPPVIEDGITIVEDENNNADTVVCEIKDEDVSSIDKQNWKDGDLSELIEETTNEGEEGTVTIVPCGEFISFSELPDNSLESTSDENETT